MYRRSELCQEETSFASLSGKFLAEPIFSFPQLLGSLEGKRATMDQQQKQTIVTESIPTFLAASRDQELIALDVHRSLLTSLDRLNAAFDNIPSVAIAGRALPPLLLSQAHSAFLGAVRMSLAGQVHVAYMALRGCIESALCAFIMKQQPSSQEAWVNRKTNRSLCRNIFANQILPLLKEIDPPLGQVVEEIYETTIDRGAHPNVLSLGSHLDFDGWDAENRLSNILLLPATNTVVEAALSGCLVAGAAVASLSMHVMPDHAPAVAAHKEAMEVIGLHIGRAPRLGRVPINLVA